jgi:hypothetical protein
MTTIANRRVFRVYLSRTAPEMKGPILVFYWDTPDRSRALIEPFLYEHATAGDLESRVAVFKVQGTDADFNRFSWQRVGSGPEDLETGIAFAELNESRGQELQRFLEECWEAVERTPDSPFRASFR